MADEDANDSMDSLELVHAFGQLGQEEEEEVAQENIGEEREGRMNPLVLSMLLTMRIVQLHPI